MRTAAGELDLVTGRRRRAAGVLLLLAAGLVAVFLLSFCLGRFGVPFVQVVRILLDALMQGMRSVLDFLLPAGALADGFLRLEQTWSAEMATVVLNIRLPRIMLACLVGCCLALAGTAYQGVFQNPMAAPDILGASSGAAFGAALAILLGLSSRGVTTLAFVSSITTIGAVFFIARRARGLQVVNLILAGIMVSSLFSAGTSYIKLVADPSNQLPAITYWLMGSLSGAQKGDLLRAAVPMLVGAVPLLLLRWRLNILTLGDEEARAMGVNTGLLRLVIVVCATLITAASVAFSGVIGWVGLVIPHLCRRLVGSDHRYLVPASMLGGAAFLLLVDDVSRNLLAVEIPIGILTAFIGAPFFIYLITRKEKTL